MKVNSLDIKIDVYGSDPRAVTEWIRGCILRSSLEVILSYMLTADGAVL